MHNNISLKFNDLGKIVSEKKENDEDKVSCDNDIDDINGELEEWVGEYTFQESFSKKQL